MPATTRVGAAFLLAGLAAFTSIHHWMATRTFVALDIPVSLVAGHIRSGPFQINLAESYAIAIETDQSRLSDTSWFDFSCVTTRWRLFKDGRQVNASREPVDGFQLGSTDADTGTYELDVEVLKEARCLYAAHPRLRVFASANSYADIASPLLWLFAICFGAGGCMLAIDGADRLRRWPPAVAPLLGMGVSRGQLRWKRRPAKAQLISRLSYFGKIYTIFYMLVFMVLAFSPSSPSYQDWRIYPHAGLRVHLMRPGIAVQPSPGIRPLLVRMEADQRLYIDSEPVTWNEFPAALRTKLKQRPPYWPVYFIGDPNLEWQFPVKAIDIVRGLQAEVVLLKSVPH